MELNNIDHNISSEGGMPHFRASIVLYICSWVFFVFQTMSADAVWTWSWRALSAISLILIIYINWNKALEIFKSKKKKHK
jgi:energy-coupling factor transporter transmembrane protein EcfT